MSPIAPPPKFTPTEFLVRPNSSGRRPRTSSIEACIQLRPPTRYGLSDSRVTLNGTAATTLPPSVITLLLVITSVVLSVSKKCGANEKSLSIPRMPWLHHPTVPPKMRWAELAPCSRSGRAVEPAKALPTNGAKIQSAAAAHGDSKSSSPTSQQTRPLIIPGEALCGRWCVSDAIRSPGTTMQVTANRKSLQRAAFRSVAILAKPGYTLKVGKV
jgi:hypothetical protein